MVASELISCMLECIEKPRDLMYRDKLTWPALNDRWRIMAMLARRDLEYAHAVEYTRPSENDAQLSVSDLLLVGDWSMHAD